jgi:hypothetical protein
MPRTLARLIVACLALALVGPSAVRAQADAPATPPTGETPGLRATQVTIAIEKGGKRRRFRATVMASRDEALTVLTAAHCLSEADEDGPALLLLDGEVVEGTVLSVVRNPSYRAGQAREIPGPDNAIARLRFRPANKPAAEAFEALRPAPAIATRSYPGPSGQTVSVRMIDGHGVEHAVRAGNYSNPRWLEWGPAYRPIPGDSGGGVFVMHPGSDGRPRPILIGIIVGRDDRGGGASLVSRDMSWIADELSR